MERQENWWMIPKTEPYCQKKCSVSYDLSLWTSQMANRNYQHKKTYLHICNYDRTPHFTKFNIFFQCEVKYPLSRVFFLWGSKGQRPSAIVNCVQLSAPGVNIYFNQFWIDLLHSSIFIKFLSAHSSNDVSLCLAMLCGGKTASEKIK